ncbi:MAG: hypothetical protein ACXWPI_18860 [Ktedonobacterales bacterium]
MAAISAIILFGVAILVVTLLRNVRFSSEAQASEPDSIPAEVPGADHTRVEASVPV